jgi:MFS family permease
LGALSFAGEMQAGNAGILVLLSLGALAFGAAFVVWERRARYPIVDLVLLADPAFSLGLVAALLSYATMFGTLFIVPFFLARALGIGPGGAGLQLTALPVALGLTAPLAGYLADRFGLRRMTTAGMTIVVGGLLLLALGRDSLALRVIALAVVGAGLGAFTPANNAAIMGAAPLQRSGSAGGVINMARGLGTSFGVALCGTIYALAQLHAARASSESGFVVTVLVLAGLAALAALAAGARAVPPTVLAPRVAREMKDRG